MILVYMATNVINGKRYIGVTSQGLHVRKSRHLSSALRQNSQTHFHRAIRKYGKVNFNFEIIQEFDSYQCSKQAEIKFINEMKPEYNMTVGGDGAEGYKHSEESRSKMSQRAKGRPGFWKGKKLPEHVCQKISARNLHPDRRAAWKKYILLGNESRKKRIVCLNDGLEYESINSASIFYGINESSIAKICKRSPTRRTVYGMVFRYWGDHLGGTAEAKQEIEAAKSNQSRGLNHAARLSL